MRPVRKTALSHRKHLAIREAGTRVFLAQGYGAATMDAIAAEAGVSKQTIYKHFQNKEMLFRAIVEGLAGALTAPLAVRDPARSSPDRILKALGHDFLRLMLAPSSLALHRLIVAESVRFPELGQTVYAAGPGHILALLAGYLAWETETGRLSVPDPECAAEQFVGMLSGRVQLRALLGVCAMPDNEEIARRVEETVAGFTRLYAAGEREAAPPAALLRRRQGIV